MSMFHFYLYSETTENETTPSPHIFYNIGWNTLNSITYNYGLNFIGSGLITWGMIETGIDWGLRNFMLDNDNYLSWLHIPGLAVGMLVPVITPLSFLISGKYLNDERLVITASALTQSLMLTLFFQSALKMVTGRSHPIIGFSSDFNDRSLYDKRSKADDFSNDFDWFNMNFSLGWPSGHTATAFSAAATLSEIYHDTLWIKVCAYSYAAAMGLSMAVHAHWASDVVAGALIGYAIGKTVGRSYRKFLEKTEDKNQPVFYFTPNTVGVNIKL